jgi:hypothetical protein
MLYAVVQLEDDAMIVLYAVFQFVEEVVNGIE